MFKASSLLLVILVLNVQLYSSAPIPGEFPQSSVVAEEPEEVAGEKGHYPEGSIQNKLIPVVAGESAPTSVEKLTPEEQTAKQDITAIAKDPEPLFIVDQETADTDDVVSQESSPQEPLAIAPQASSEKETVTVRPAFVEVLEVALGVAVESDPPAALIPIFPLEALEDEASEGNADVAVESTAEEASPEGPLIVDPEINAEVEPTASQETLVGASEQKSVILVETEEADKVQPAAEQSSPEEPDVILDPEEPAQHEPEPEKTQETVLIMSLEAEEDVEEHAEEAETVALVVVEENAEEPLASTTEEEESVCLFPAELETEEGDRVEPAAEVTVLLESAPEDPVVIAPMKSAKEEPDLEEQEETVPIVFSVTEKEEAPGEHEKEVEEGNTKDDAATNKDLPPQEESVILVHEKVETEEADKLQPAAEQSGPEEPDVILDPEEPAQHEPEPEKQQETVLIMSLEAEEDVEEHAEEAETVALVVVEENAEEPLASTTEEEESVCLFPAELETEEGDRVEPAAEVTVLLESAPEDPVVITPMKSAKEEPDLEEQEETVPIVFSVTEKEEAPGEHENEVEEGNTEEDAATNKDLPPQEESVVLVPVEPEIEDQAEPTVDETVPQESAPEDPVVVASVIGELDLEEQIDEEAIVSPEASEEETPDDHAKVEAAIIVESGEMLVPIASVETAEEKPATDEEPLHSTPEEEKAIVLVPAEECQETSAKCPKCKCKEETEPQESGPEDNTGERAEAVLQSDPLPHEPVLEEDTAPEETEPDDSDAVIRTTSGVMEGTNGTTIKTHREDFKAANKLIKDEPVVPVRRAAVLGAAFFTLMSFIVIGFVLITISKKLR